MKKTLSELNVKGKTVFVRVDFNVPLKEGQIRDDNRIVEALPTIQWLIKQNAKVVLLSHLGKVDHKDPVKKEQDLVKNNLAPVAVRLGELLHKNVAFAPVPRGETLKKAVLGLTSGDVLLVQNTRYDKGEEKNDLELAKEWASLADAYVMDAFGSAHRAHASTVGLPELLKQAKKETAIGLLVQKEVEAISKCVKAEVHPYVAILGGLKVSDKIKVIEALLSKTDKVIIGGAMAYTFFKALGYDTGRSPVELDQVEFAKKCLAQAGKKIVLPVDSVVANDFDKPTEIKEIKAGDPLGTFMGMDIGPKTIELFRKELQGAKMIFWNGPAGVFEKEAFTKGTKGLCEAITSVKGAYTVIGGGDSAAAAAQFGYKEKFSHVSTGGGASLEMIENNGSLPGIDVISDR